MSPANQIHNVTRSCCLSLSSMRCSCKSTLNRTLNSSTPPSLNNTLRACVYFLNWMTMWSPTSPMMVHEHVNFFWPVTFLLWRLMRCFWCVGGPKWRPGLCRIGQPAAATPWRVDWRHIQPAAHPQVNQMASRDKHSPPAAEEGPRSGIAHPWPG